MARRSAGRNHTYSLQLMVVVEGNHTLGTLYFEQFTGDKTLSTVAKFTETKENAYGNLTKVNPPA